MLLITHFHIRDIVMLLKYTVVALLACMVMARPNGASPGSCGFADPDGGNPGGSSSTTHGTKMAGNGMFDLMVESTVDGDGTKVVDSSKPCTTSALPSSSRHQIARVGMAPS